MKSVPNYVSHYYEKKDGPFQSMTKDGFEKANIIFKKLKDEGKSTKSKFPESYVNLRFDVEEWLRTSFIKRGGKPINHVPYYTLLGDCKWLLDWYEEGAKKMIPLSDLKGKSVSFTFPDSMISYQLAFQKDMVKSKQEDDKPYYGKVYLLEELEEVIKKYGLPTAQVIDGRPSGWDMYIEIQIWEDL